MRKKVNDYYYRVKSPFGEWSGWLTWREVCSERKDHQLDVVAKILISEYDKDPSKHETWKLEAVFTNEQFKVKRGF